jgi:transcriptional regulator with XRE-family HTH domain
MDNKEYIKQRFAKNLKALREKKGISLRELSLRANLEYSQVQRIEKGKVNLSLTTMIALAEGLDVHPKKLLDFDFEENSTS